MARHPRVHLLLRRPNDETLSPDLYGANDVGDRLTRLAAALASSPILADMGATTFVVRQHPTPVLAAIGEFDETDEARLIALAHMLERVLPTTRYVDYAAAETVSRTLADRLVERFGEDEIRRAELVPIPRGGYIVQGMLAYLLGIEASGEAGGPTIVVDDCALSGARFRRFLKELAADEDIVFAHLYSAPELRSAIESAQRGVHCVSGEDLVDLAPEQLGGEHAAWQETWRQRTGEDAYWFGQTEHIVFSWNEPDVSVWNPVLGTRERGWNLAPPDRCMKNRGAALAEVFIVPGATGGVDAHPDAVWAKIDGRIVVGNSDTGAVVALDDTAADLWEALMAAGSTEEAVAALGESYAVDHARLGNDLAAFVLDLRERNLLA